MNEKLLAESKGLHKEAEKILKASRLFQILKKFGKVQFTGSYAADLMMKPDVDIYVLAPVFTKKKVLQAYNKILNIPHFYMCAFFDYARHRHPELDIPRAYYVKLNAVGKKGARWKIDLWFLTPKDLRRVKHFDLSTRKITPTQKKAILQFKKIREKYMYSIPSHMIYDAVLEHDIQTLPVLKRFLKRK